MRFWEERTVAEGVGDVNGLRIETWVEEREWQGVKKRLAKGFRWDTQVAKKAKKRNMRRGEVLG